MMKQNDKPEKNSGDRLLQIARKNIIKQAILAGFTIMVTVVLLFAMTTAWYSNVVQTSGLIFEAESWGVEGEVAVQADVINAAPGDSGIVYLKVTNSSDELSAVTVNITKEYMSPVQMQQRVYFYVDEQAVVNGETTTRQYLKNTGGHTYMLFGQNTLILSEEIHTDALIKWEWVYDVVGYYVYGTVTDGVMTVEEYLRPIEYNYDHATFDADGNLLTVDGTTSVNDFLARLTSGDGYAGAYSVSEDGVLLDSSGSEVSPVNGYYPVAVDGTKAVWLYLCSKAEIEENTRWDTAFGEATEEETQFQARITVTAQQINMEPVLVSDVDELTAALAAADGELLRLENSLALSETMALPEGTDALLDLNGYSIAYTGSDYAFNVGQGSELTMINGSIKGDEELGNSAFYVVGGQVTLSNVTMENMYRGLNIEDHKSGVEQGSNSCIRIVDCELTTQEVTVKINGDGSLSDANTSLVIQNSTIISEGYAGVLGNGNSGNWGTDIQIIDSTVSGFYASIYHPQRKSTLTVTRSTLTGMTGMAIKGGQISIVDTVVTGTGEDGTVIAEPTEEMLSGSGWLDTGDGIYVESDYGHAIEIEITGECKVSATASTAKAIRVFPEANYVEIAISGGTFSTDVSQYMTEQ